MAFVAEMLQPAEDFFRLSEEVGNDDEQPFSFQALGEIMKGLPEARIARGWILLEFVDQLLQVRGWLPSGRNRRTQSSNSTSPTESCCCSIMYAREAAR